MPPQNNSNVGVTLVGVFVTLAGLAVCWLLWKTNCCGHLKLRNSPPKKPRPPASNRSTSPEAQPPLEPTRRDDRGPRNTSVRNTSVRNESQTQRPSMIVHVEREGTFNYLVSGDIVRMSPNTGLGKGPPTRGVLTDAEMSKFNGDPSHSGHQAPSFPEGGSFCSSAPEASQNGNSTSKKEPRDPPLSQHGPASSSNMPPLTSNGPSSSKQRVPSKTSSAQAKSLTCRQPTENGYQGNPTAAEAGLQWAFGTESFLATSAPRNLSAEVEVLSTRSLLQVPSIMGQPSEEVATSNRRASTLSNDQPSSAKDAEDWEGASQEKGSDGNVAAKPSTEKGDTEGGASKEPGPGQKMTDDAADGKPDERKTIKDPNKKTEDEITVEKGDWGVVGPQPAGGGTAWQPSPQRPSWDGEDAIQNPPSASTIQDINPKDELTEERMEGEQKPGEKELDEQRAEERLGENEDEGKMEEKTIPGEQMEEKQRFQEQKSEERAAEHTSEAEGPSKSEKQTHEKDEKSPSKRASEEWGKEEEAPKPGAVDDGGNQWGGGSACTNKNEWDSVKEDRKQDTNAGGWNSEPSHDDASAKQPEAEDNLSKEEAVTEVTWTKKSGNKKSLTKHRSKNGNAKEQSPKKPLWDASSVGNKQQTTGKKSSPKTGRSKSPSKASSS